MEFFIKINRRACTSIWYTRTLLGVQVHRRLYIQDRQNTGLKLPPQILAQIEAKPVPSFTALRHNRDAGGGAHCLFSRFFPPNFHFSGDQV